MKKKDNNKTVDRSRLTLLGGLAASAAGGGCEDKSLIDIGLDARSANSPDVVERKRQAHLREVRRKNEAIKNRPRMVRMTTRLRRRAEERAEERRRARAARARSRARYQSNRNFGRNADPTLILGEGGEGGGGGGH